MAWVRTESQWYRREAQSSYSWCSVPTIMQSLTSPSISTHWLSTLSVRSAIRGVGEYKAAWGRAVEEWRNIVISYTFIILYSLQSTEHTLVHLNIGPQTNLRSMYSQYTSISEETKYRSRGHREWQSQDTTQTPDLKNFQCSYRNKT